MRDEYLKLVEQIKKRRDELGKLKEEEAKKLG